MRNRLVSAVLAVSAFIGPLTWTACGGGSSDPSCTPTAETCNGVDDDCDGQADEPGAQGCTQYFRDVDADGHGVTSDPRCLCAPAAPYTPTVGGDCDDASASVHPGATEICNGIDDNCDAQTDEGLVGCCAPANQKTCGVNLGICTPGTQTCGADFAWGACLDASAQPVILPGTVAEVCDGLDNDCDGAIDEGNPGGGGACSTGLLGVCAAGTTSCVSGTIACVESVAPSTEVCANGIDDNCNGATDEGGCI